MIGVIPCRWIPGPAADHPSRRLARGVEPGPRTAGQLAILASLPTVAVTSLIAFNVIPATLSVALASGAALLILIRLGGRFASALFDRERLITSIK